jgi:predicted RNA methylase
VIVQDDGGGRSVRVFCTRFCKILGLYDVRPNTRTRHFVTSVVMAGDVIMSTHSHQQVLIAILNEHVNLFGFKVKILSRAMEEFPGGYHFHQRTKVYMRSNHIFST